MLFVDVYREFKSAIVSPKNRRAPFLRVYAEKVKKDAHLKFVSEKTINATFVFRWSSDKTMPF